MRANFNPRTPVGCDHHYPGNGDRAVHISIHAPQWGATRRRRDHTPIRKYFNPRTPVGCDNQLQRGQSVPIRISIHAPQWGATWTCATSRAMMVYFNPRTPVGCDPRWICKRAWSSTFQSTHPSGVRRGCGNNCDSALRFQSTHPSGVRLGDRPVLARATDFNPRTPVGCDPDMSALPEFDEFQSTHPSGVRRRWR